jgi:hypothetical protein
MHGRKYSPGLYTGTTTLTLSMHRLFHTKTTGRKINARF